MNILTKKLTLFLFIVFCASSIKAQNFTLNQLLKLMEENYPLAKQIGMLDSVAYLQTQNAGKMWLPQVALNGQGTYQSAVTSVPISIPGISIASLPKDQYKVTLDASQLLYDGGLAKSQKSITNINSLISKQQNAIDLYKIKQQIISYFMNIILLDKTLSIYSLSMKDLEETQKKTQALYKNDYVIKSSVSFINTQIITLKQSILDAQYNRKSLIQNLALLTKSNISDNSTFEDNYQIKEDLTFRRPELELMSLQKQSLESQINLTKAQNRPKLSVFGQGGYGRPGLNMLSPNFDFFFYGGVRFSYPISNLYTFKNQKYVSKLQSKIIDNQQEILLENLQLQLNQTNNDIEKYTEQMKLDDSNISQCDEILKASKAMYDASTLTLDDYTSKLNKLQQARISKSIHEINLLFSKINQLFITGNL